MSVAKDYYYRTYDYRTYVDNLQAIHSRASHIDRLKKNLKDIKEKSYGDSQEMCREMWTQCEAARLPDVCEQDDAFKKQCRSEKATKRKHAMRAFAVNPYFSAPSPKTNSKQQVFEGLSKKILKPKIDDAASRTKAYLSKKNEKNTNDTLVL